MYTMPPPPDNQRTDWLDYEAYLNTLNEDFQKLLGALDTMPAGDAIALIMIILLPFIARYEQIQMGEAGEVINTASKCMNGVSALQADFNAFGNELQSEGLVNYTGGPVTWDNLTSDEQATIQSATTIMWDFYDQFLTTVHDDYNHSSFPPNLPTQPSGGPFEGIYNSVISEMEQVGGFNWNDYYDYWLTVDWNHVADPTGAEQMANDLLAVWASAWMDAQNSGSEPGNPAQLNGVNTGFSAMQNNFSGVSSQMQSQYKMLSSELQQMLALDHTIMQQMIQMEQSVNQQMSQQG